jgi:hypothetical protein
LVSGAAGSDRWAIPLSAGFAYSVRKWSEKAKAAQRAKAESGIFPGMAPLGYVNEEWKGMKRIYVDTEVAEKVVRLFEFAASGLSLSRIRLRAHSLGVKARGGKILGRSSV